MSSQPSWLAEFRKKYDDGSLSATDVFEAIARVTPSRFKAPSRERPVGYSGDALFPLPFLSPVTKKRKGWSRQESVEADIARTFTNCIIFQINHLYATDYHRVPFQDYKPSAAQQRMIDTLAHTAESFCKTALSLQFDDGLRAAVLKALNVRHASGVYSEPSNPATDIIASRVALPEAAGQGSVLVDDTPQCLRNLLCNPEKFINGPVPDDVEVETSSLFNSEEDVVMLLSKLFETGMCKWVEEDRLLLRTSDGRVLRAGIFAVSKISQESVQRLIINMVNINSALAHMMDLSTEEKAEIKRVTRMPKYDDFR